MGWRHRQPVGIPPWETPTTLGGATEATLSVAIVGGSEYRFLVDPDGFEGGTAAHLAGRSSSDPCQGSGSAGDRPMDPTGEAPSEAPDYARFSVRWDGAQRIGAVKISSSRDDTARSSPVGSGRWRHGRGRMVVWKLRARFIIAAKVVE